jgi:hypothetical protein
MAENAAREDQHEPERHEPEHHEPGARHGTPPQKGGKVKRFLDDHKLAVISVALGVLGILIVLWLRNRSSSSSASTTPSGATLGQGNAPGSSGGGGGTWWPGTGTGATSNPASTTTPNVTVNVPAQPTPVVNVTLTGSSGAQNVKKAPRTPTRKSTGAPPSSAGAVAVTANRTAGVHYLAQEPAPTNVSENRTSGVRYLGQTHNLPNVTENRSASMAYRRSASVVTQSKSPAKAVSSRAHALSGGQTSLTQAQALQV